MSKILYIILFSTLLISQTIKGGSISDGLDLAKIKVSEHKDYTRVVFYVNFWEGHSRPNTPADTTGGYKFVLSDDKKNIMVELLGFRSASIKNIVNVDSIKSFKRLTGEKYADDSSLFYNIELTNPSSSIKAFALENPSRVIIDIY